MDATLFLPPTRFYNIHHWYKTTDFPFYNDPINHFTPLHETFLYTLMDKEVETMPNQSALRKHNYMPSNICLLQWLPDFSANSFSGQVYITFIYWQHLIGKNEFFLFVSVGIASSRIRMINESKPFVMKVQENWLNAYNFYWFLT